MTTHEFELNRPHFRILSNKKIEQLHYATLKILSNTGVSFHCKEAIVLLGDAGADVSNPNRIKIPSRLVENALNSAPKEITLYTREGTPAMVLNGKTGSHFGGSCDTARYLDPFTRKPRGNTIHDICDMARLHDALPNIEWSYTSTGHPTLPGEIADKVVLLQVILNTSNPVFSEINDEPSLREMINLCSIIAGGEDKLRERPFFGGTSEPITPLTQGKEALEKSLLCAEKGIPNVIYNMPMAGSTAPATFAGCLAVANAEVLSQLVVVQLKNPGTPVIYGAMPSVMDMNTTIYSYGAPEKALMVGAITELSHYYKLPFFGTAACVDSELINAQAGTEITYQLITTMLTGADFVHNVGLMYHCTMVSPELMVYANEIIDMVKVLVGGIDINNETLALDMIDRVGPQSDYMSEEHTFKHFRNFWMPKLFDRSFVRTDIIKDCDELINEKTIELLKTHKPKPLPDELFKELKKVEKSWFDSVGLKQEYQKRG